MTSVEPDNCVIYPSMLKSSFFLFSKHVFSAQLNNNNNIASRFFVIFQFRRYDDFNINRLVHFVRTRSDYFNYFDQIRLYSIYYSAFFIRQPATSFSFSFLSPESTLLMKIFQDTFEQKAHFFTAEQQKCLHHMRINQYVSELIIKIDKQDVIHLFQIANHRNNIIQKCLISLPAFLSYFCNRRRIII